MIFRSFLMISFLFLQSMFAYSQGIGKVAEKPAAKGLSYGIVVDNSAAFKNSIEKLQGMVASILESNKARDEAFLLSFVDSGKINLMHGFTDSKEALKESASEMHSQGGLTAVLNAVDFAARHIVEYADLKNDKAIILITDGEDRGSSTKIENLLKILKEEKIKVFSIGISEKKVSKKGSELLFMLAKESGGKARLLATADSEDTIEASIAEIAEEMRR